ncbi:3-phenylpropionate MFS transporter [Luteithermobacter gelatinilyticus]|uniref:3-phenylpropionate MFS transporter n=1 Tax=Luteithermobacter gelatinilyticus TaxID=2582913 RepID=UPI0011061B3D|nr:3-phenylpropionate MFS transporter [Luteithermobacter gelatinilyticus]
MRAGRILRRLLPPGREEAALVSIKLGNVYGGLFLYIGVLLPFWAVWMQSKGLSPSEIGIIMTVPFITKPFIPLLVTQFADRIGSARPLFLINLGLSVIFFVPYLFVDSFWEIFWVTVLFNLFVPSLMPLLESMSVYHTRKLGIHYGRVRSAGSLTFIFSSLLMGAVLTRSTTDWVMVLALVFLALSFSAALFLPEDQRRKMPEENGERSVGEEQETPLKFLLTNRNFLIFLAVSGLIQMSHGVYYGMGSLYWKTHGIPENIIGLLWSVGVVAEIIVFMFCSKIIAALRPMHVFMVIGLSGVIRWIILGGTLSVPVLLLAQLIHGLTYGAAHLAAIYYIAARVPQNCASTAQGLYSAIPLGLASGATMMSAGYLYEGFGGKAYWGMALMCLLAVLVARKLRRVTEE